MIALVDCPLVHDEPGIGPAPKSSNDCKLMAQSCARPIMDKSNFVFGEKSAERVKSGVAARAVGSSVEFEYTAIDHPTESN